MLAVRDNELDVGGCRGQRGHEKITWMSHATGRRHENRVGGTTGKPGKAGLGNHVFNPNIRILRLGTTYLDVGDEVAVK